MTKGIATEARATYLRTSELAADLASLIKPRNMVGLSAYVFQIAPRTKPTAAATAKVAIG